MKVIHVTAIAFIGYMVSIAGVILLRNATGSLHYRSSLLAPSIIYEQTPEGYYKNQHVMMDAVASGNQYSISMQFKDRQNNMLWWKWTYNQASLDAEVKPYGVPPEIFEPYPMIDSVIQRRNRIMKESLFVQEDMYLLPDMLRMTELYKPYMKPVTDLVVQTTGQQATLRSRLELLLKFHQDIPYGVPPQQFNNKYIGGLFPPPQMLVNTFGDCDSKAVSFLAACRNLPDCKAILLFETNHVIPAFRGVPKPYDAFYEYRNYKWILAESAGPGRPDMGVMKKTYTNYTKVLEVIK